MKLVFCGESYQFIGRSPKQHETFYVFFGETGDLFNQWFGEAAADEFLLFLLNESVAEAPHGLVFPEFEDADQAIGIQIP